MLTSIMLPADLPVARQIKASVKNGLITRTDLAAILSDRGYYNAQAQVDGIRQCLDELRREIMREQRPFLFGVLYPLSALQDFFSSQESVKVKHEGRRREVIVIRPHESIVKVHESNGWLTLILESKEEARKDNAD